MEINRQIQLFDKQVKRYAKPLKENSSEYRLRKNLLGSANGDILELSVGAGTNFIFYPKNAKITAVDFSPSMIGHARLKASQERLNVEFITANVEEADLEAGQYDTVISTLSLCSYPNPEKVLERMAHWVRPDGQILLMEHGISTNPVYAWLQNKANPFLLKKFGCNHNRDIVKLVEASPVRVKKAESFWLNSLHLIWASPRNK
ncbi:class I SAM-dependent methyltransferase [Neobacillus sp. YIM B06451]|uniref:class I SAM-dependent methyltransferase n=1 Tax=Neobacillus sp. YIM B06451 TaxID=3070994 RepID=UPI00292E0478|nr:class I SAM-dependent methyltransferase [Neobacillus sp. YIM B06451]